MKTQNKESRDGDDIPIAPVKDTFIREEVIALLTKVIKDSHTDELEEHYSGDYRNLNKWIEENLK